MIQRIQSVYLLVACLLLVMGAFNLYTTPEISLADYRMVFASAYLVLAVAVLVAIFLFGDRLLQANLVGAVRVALLIVVIVLFMVLYLTHGFPVIVASGFSGILGTLVVPVGALVVIHLARMAIVRDISLIRSMDRLR